MTKRIGFACKWSELDAKGRIVSPPEYNFKTTTAAWLSRQKREVAEQRLYEIMVHNIKALEKLVRRVGSLNNNLRMVRIGSDVFPMYTHRDYVSYWKQPHIVAYAETHLARVGELARSLDVRLSMHPGQFTVLASDNEGIVENSIREFEYHADVARMLGYGKRFQDFKINVHISGRQGPDGIRAAYKKLSPEARNCITIENEEITHGIEHCLAISDIVPIVLDIHHHWIREGEYINAGDDRCKRVVDSWRGNRPTIHYSVSREDVLEGHDETVAPDHSLLLETGHKKQKLRAHSDFYWNEPVTDWALTFLENSDIMCESKAKNLASFKVYERAKEIGVLS